MRGCPGPGVRADPLGLIGLLGLLAWAARRGRPDAGPPTILIRHSSAFRLTTLLTAVAIPTVLMLAFAVLPPVREEGRYVLALFGVVMAVTLPMYWEAVRYYVFATPHGLECRSPCALRAISPGRHSRGHIQPTTGWFAFRAWDGDASGAGHGHGRCGASRRSKHMSAIGSEKGRGRGGGWGDHSPDFRTSHSWKPAHRAARSVWLVVARNTGDTPLRVIHRGP